MRRHESPACFEIVGEADAAWLAVAAKRVRKHRAVQERQQYRGGANAVVHDRRPVGCWLGQPALIQAAMSERRQRTKVPSLTGRGIFPESESLKMWRLEHPPNSAATAWTSRSSTGSSLIGVDPLHRSSAAFAGVAMINSPIGIRSRGSVFIR